MCLPIILSHAGVGPLANDHSGGLAPLNPPAAWGAHLDTNMAIYTHISSNYTHICPIIDTLGVLDLTIGVGPFCVLRTCAAHYLLYVKNPYLCSALER